LIGSRQSEQRRSQIFHSKPNSLCGGCHNEINGEHITALGATWHLTCFLCSDCRDPINGDFYQIDNQNLCKSCVGKKLRCSKCSNPILTDYFVSDGQHFHKGCLPISTCVKCFNPIQADVRSISALGDNYHLECFKCFGCNSTLNKDGFFNKDGRPHCENCSASESQSNVSSSSCSFCKNRIEPGVKFVKYEGSEFHEHCFTCQVCASKLSTELFYKNNFGKRCCESCARKEQNNSTKLNNRMSTSNYCGSCGVSQKIGANFCHHCGTKIL